MSFSMGSQGSQNGMALQHSGYRSFGDVNGHMQQHPPPGHAPQIYTAIYSGVSVYEMEVNGIAVMRRRADSWLNATQILKVGGVEKGKRTKVLEKEILVGEHEKVQGGYGKYQGTWIKYNRGVEFCRQYGVEDLLRPLLEYDMGQDGVTMAGQGGVETPTKEQAMAAQRKRLYNAGIDSRPTSQSANGTFFKNISATASNAVAAINKAHRYPSPGPRPGSGSRRPNTGRRPSQQMMGSQESSFPGGSQQSIQSFASENSFGANGQTDSAYGTQSNAFFSNFPDHGRNGDMQEPPRKKMRPSSHQESFGPTIDGNADVSMIDETPTEPNESFVYQQHGLFLPPENEPVMALEPLPQPRTNGKGTSDQQQLLLSLFANQHQTDFSKHDVFRTLTGHGLDIPIDASAHTALHWAAAMGRVPLLKTLIAGGASIFRVNGGGETALMRACITTNNLDHGSFPEILELLGPTIEMRDGRGRTILHHIAITSAVKGRSASSRYHLESLLEFVVRQGSAPSSQQNSFNLSNGHPAQAMHKPISLSRFMSEIVNARDKSGDTALNLVARIGNRSIIQQLIEVGADATIPNRGGLRPIDFGVGGEIELDGHHGIQAPYGHEAEPEVLSKVVGETSRDIMSSISTLLSETETSFAKEMRSKQDQIEATHAKIREYTANLNEERRRLENMQRKAADRADMTLKIQNLRRAADEQRSRLSQQKGGVSNGMADIKVGDADKGLDIKLEELPEPALRGEVVQMEQLTKEECDYLKTLPSTEVLRARLNAYNRNNQMLGEQAAQLKSRSTDLEEKYRRVISLCTGVEEDHVEELLPGLVKAVESEGGEMVEVGRVRDFLKKVEGG
ncbi:MAG: transcriptional regulator swi6 [Candelina mexicana]|nr:MAG: transcriptional regulator swi6 [Candelina mexicana]